MLSHRFRLFSPPISSGETSAAIDSRQPVVPSRLRLASTIRGRSATSSTLSSWIAPATTRAASSVVSPRNVCTSISSSRLVSLDSTWLKAAALHLLKGRADDLLEFLFVRPADVEGDGQPAHLRRQARRRRSEPTSTAANLGEK